ncbi:MAG: hypothetical protein JW953_16025 [Anaerolineae bacterium]|nr:hypothetical protein [Anaerolineae bacterium]
MKKVFLSSLTLTTLVLFGLVAFIVIARPGLGQSNNLAAVADVSQPVVAVSFDFDPQLVDYQVSQPDYAWIDLSDSSDEQIKPADFEDNVGSAAIDLGFYFPFFDHVYRQVRVSDNGYLYFGGEQTDGGSTPQAVPSQEDLIHNLIAPLGADLFRNPADSVVYIARQTEPDRRLVVQFENAYWCCNLEAANNFQVILYPDGRILTQYQSVQSQDPAHAYVTVGLENEDGSRGQSFYTGLLNKTDVFKSELAVLYNPGDTVLGRLLFMPETGHAQAAPGQSATFNTDLLNLSGVDSTFTITHTLQVNGVDVPLHPVAAEESQEADAPDESTGPEGTAEPPATWGIKTLTEPGQVNHTEAGPLAVEIIIPQTAQAGDVAVITFRALPDAITELEAVATFTIEVTSANPE